VQYGEGIVPFEETFRSLAEIGFWGMLGAEMWGSMHGGIDPLKMQPPLAALSPTWSIVHTQMGSQPYEIKHIHNMIAYRCGPTSKCFLR
jgi:L-ribulose-5-phosphate 3-epimerase UlaE